MPTYYQHYSCLITSNMNASVNYLLKIYRTIPNPLGYMPDLLLAGTPVIQEWQEDDPLAPIRGCTLKINIIANHDLPYPYINVNLTDFYSENDNEFYVELIDNQNSELVFAGYIMQDDCSELQADYAHEIQLVATDNLATLKEIRLDQAVIDNAIPRTYYGAMTSYISGGKNYITFAGPNLMLTDGQSITISLTASALDGTWTVVSQTFTNTPFAQNTIIIAETVPTVIAVNGNLSYDYRMALRGYLTVREIFRNCIMSTNLALAKTNVLANLYPTTGTNGNWFDDTYLNVLSFKNDSTWDSCYDILEKLMARFRATLFQAHGQWWVVRWGELWRWADGNGMAFYGWEYVSDLQGPGSATGWTNYNAPFQYGEIEAGLLRSIVRPYKYVQETMQYNQVANIITNGDLSILGPLIRTYTATIDGVLCDINEYEAPYWYYYPLASPILIEYYIRVAIAQNTGQEVQRLLVLNTSDAVTPAIYSNDIDVEIGDVIEFSFDVKTSISQTGNNSFIFYLYISDTAGSTFTGLQPNTSGYWVSVPGINMQYSGINTNEWATFSVKTFQSPRRGRMVIALPGICFGGGETYIQNMRISISNGVNSLQRIIGHRHQDSIDLVLKNIDEKEIAIDDTRSNLIAGTTFLETYTDLIRDRIQTWNFDTGTQILETQLGRITTQEIEFWRRKPRAKFNGSLLKTYSFTVGRAISPVFCILLNIGGLTDYRYIFGSLTLNYKRNSADFTLYEICQLGENISDFNDDTYTFNYLYENN